MNTLDIVTFPDAFLKKTTQPVVNIDGEIQRIIDQMADTMYQAPGIGLAAIQVGIDKSILIYDVAPGDGERTLGALINPRIVAQEGEILSENEGCLSVPDFRSDVKRSAAVLVEGYDRHEKELRFEAHDLLAIVLQHEIDHLNGVLFIDRISALKRQFYKRRVLKQMKKEA